MGDPDMTPLAEATLPVLMAEMERRYDSFVFAWTVKRTENENDWGSWRRGNTITCIGLARRLDVVLNAYLNGDLDEEEDEDD